MYDVMFFAITECIAQVDAEGCGFLLGESLSGHDLSQTGQILHPDEDVPPELVRICAYFIVFYSNDIGSASEIHHQGDLIYTAVNDLLKILPGRLFVPVFRTDSIDLCL